MYSSTVVCITECWYLHSGHKKTHTHLLTYTYYTLYTLLNQTAARSYKMMSRYIQELQRGTAATAGICKYSNRITCISLLQLLSYNIKQVQLLRWVITSALLLSLSLSQRSNLLARIILIVPSHYLPFPYSYTQLFEAAAVLG